MKIFLMLIFLLNSSFVFARSGDEVRNGGGLAESYLIFALKNMDQTIAFCLSQSECAKKNDGREILKKIKASLSTEVKADLLKFSNEAKKPGFFTVDGYVRLAVTGNNVGDTIFYNLDLLYQNGEVKINYGQAVQSLIHELGHHQGIANHDQLELVGAEVRASVDGSISETAFLPHLNTQGFFALGTETKSFKDSGALILLFRDSMTDMTPHFSNLLNECDKDETSADPLESRALQFFNLHWNPAQVTTVTSDKILSGNVILYCRHKYTKYYRNFYEFNLGVTVQMGSAFIYKDAKLLARPKFLFKMLKNSL